MLQQVRSFANSAIDFATDKISDSHDRSLELLQSSLERDRLSGLRRLARSNDPRAIDIALSTRENDSSDLVKVKAESALIILCEKHPERKAEIAEKLMKLVTESNMEESNPSSNAQHTFETVGKLLSGVLLDEQQQGRLIGTVENWWQQRINVAESLIQSSRGSTFATGEISVDELSEASKIKAEADCDLALALKAVPGATADQLRLKLLQNIEPGPFADLLFATIAPHAESPSIQARLQEIQTTWKQQHDPTINKYHFAALRNCIVGISKSRF